MFIPAARTYVNLSADSSNQNFISTTAASLLVHSQRQGTSLNLNWFGISNVTYQTLYSTNLFDWSPYGAPFIGTNGSVTLQVPIGADHVDLRRLQYAG